MELAFSSPSLRTICEDEARAENELGSEVAEVLKRRLADMRAATSLIDIVVGQPRELDGADRKLMAIDLCENYRIVFCPNHPKSLMIGISESEWSKVTRLRILRIERDDG